MVLVGVGVEEKLAFMSVNYYFALNKDRVEGILFCRSI